MPKARTIRIAGAQMTCHLGWRDDNLARAEQMATQAAAAGAQLVLFPELMPSGYTLSPRIWQGVEPPDGPTARWLRRTSADLGVFLGTSYAEFDKGHIYNTFVLTTPDGSEAGRVRKAHAETYFFRRERGSHVIDCDLGRVGVGICADNHRADFAHLMRSAHVDLLLMPHAGPAANVVGGLVSEADVRNQHESFRTIAPLYARMLGAPALFANQCGPMPGERGTGIVGSALNRDRFHFAGLTTIADSDGSMVASLTDGDGLAIGDVIIDPSRRPEAEPALHGSYVTQGNWLARHVVFPIDGLLSRPYYALHRRSVRIGPDCDPEAGEESAE